MPPRYARNHGAPENCTRCVTSWTATHSRKSAGSSAELLFHVDDVRPDEVDQAVVIGRQEDVELSEDAARHVAEQGTDLRADGLARDDRAVALALEQALRERFHEALQRRDVLPDPIAAAHHPGARSESRDRHPGELGDQTLGVGDVERQVLAQPRAILRDDLRPGAGHAPADLDRGVPVRQARGVRAHGPVDVGERFHGPGS